MKLKKITILFLTGALLVGSLTGCGAKKEAAADAASTDAATEKAADAGESVAADAGSSEKPYDGITLTMLKDSDATDAGINAVTALAEEKLGIKVEVEIRVGGADGDNIVKTRLASGDMADICMYNSGSLLAALNPAEYFVDISKEEFAARLDDTYKETVTIDGATYGVPFSSSQGGAIVYSKPIYEELGLSIPTTWDDFIKNCEAIKAAGKTAMIGTFGDSWTSQVMYLGDNYNVMAANPTFAEDFQAGRAKYATTPAGVQSFQKLVDVQGFYNEDYLAATYDDGCDMLANAEGAHWAMLTQCLSNIYELYPDKIQDLGVFAIPGDSAEVNGLTVWMPPSLYANKNAEKLDAVLAFMDFYTTKDAIDAYTSAVLPDGPYCIKGYQLPENAYPAVKDDMQSYFDSGKTIVALEFLTAVKGPNCLPICQEVGSGQTTAMEAAKAYDEDCKKQAVQLGLKWE